MSKTVSCKIISKTFGQGDTEVHALQGVDLELEPGKLLMIVGPSGSGKTTLISIIAGILDATEGECTVLGKNLREMQNSELTLFRGKNIGFVFQAFNLIPMLTAKENVAVPLILNGHDPKESLKRAGDLLAHFGLEDKINELPQNLSGGQQQRVAIARSCIHEPSLIVCDEPTSSLDHETGTHVMDLFRKEVLEKNRSLIIVTHDARIFDYADQIITIDDGKLSESQNRGSDEGH